MYFICYYNQHLSCWTILGNSWLERIEGTLGVSTVLSKFPLANFWHVIYIPWVIKELSSTFFTASLWDIFSLHHNYSYEQKQKQGAVGGGQGPECLFRLLIKGCGCLSWAHALGSSPKQGWSRSAGHGVWSAGNRETTDNCPHLWSWTPALTKKGNTKKTNIR